MAMTGWVRASPRTWLFSGILVVVLGSGGLDILLSAGSRRASTEVSHSPSTSPSVLRIEEDGLRYTYHLMSGTEALFDIRSDPRALRNLLLERPEDARRLRRRLEGEQGVEDLEELRAPHREAIRELEALGYL